MSRRGCPERGYRSSPTPRFALRPGSRPQRTGSCVAGAQPMPGPTSSGGPATTVNRATIEHQIDHLWVFVVSERLAMLLPSARSAPSGPAKERQGATPGLMRLDVAEEIT